jgi:DNA-binding transcriptional MerR regulator
VTCQTWHHPFIASEGTILIWVNLNSEGTSQIFFSDDDSTKNTIPQLPPNFSLAEHEWTCTHFHTHLLLTMMFKKLSGDFSSGDESPNKNDDNADGASPDDTRGDRPTADKADNKGFRHLEALLATERKKRAKAEQLQQNKHSTEHGIALKKVKTVLAEHKARDAAALGAKNEKLKAKRLTSKELLSNKENLLKESQKSCSQLVKALKTSSKDLKKVQESISKHNNSRLGQAAWPVALG